MMMRSRASSRPMKITCKLGRADSIAVIGTVLREILAAGENPAEAFAVLQRSADMHSKLRQQAEAQEIESLINKLGPVLS